MVGKSADELVRLILELFATNDKTHFTIEYIWYISKTIVQPLNDAESFCFSYVSMRIQDN